jgi:Ca2+-binding RTX toxin-like protein
MSRLATCSLLAASLLIAAALAPTGAGGQGAPSTCTYVEAGPPGNAGNILRIASSEAVTIYRDGQQLRVFDSSAPRLARVDREVRCTGPEATVRNLDRIRIVPRDVTPDLVIDGSGRGLEFPSGPVQTSGAGGTLGPGATAEAEGPEIEVTFGRLDSSTPSSPASIWFRGGPGADSVTSASLLVRRPGLNLNAAADGGSPDLDVIGTRQVAGVFLFGGPGADRLSAEGFQQLPLRRIGLHGDGGNDNLLGSPRADTLKGGPGNDRMRGYKGNDRFDTSGPSSIAAGSDLAWGDPGADRFGPSGARTGLNGFDRFFGRAGDDVLRLRDGGADVGSCGPGRDVLELDRGTDRHRGCEVLR